MDQCREPLQEGGRAITSTRAMGFCGEEMGPGDVHCFGSSSVWLVSGLERRKEVESSQTRIILAASDRTRPNKTQSSQSICFTAVSHLSKGG